MKIIPLIVLAAASLASCVPVTGAPTNSSAADTSSRNCDVGIFGEPPTNYLAVIKTGEDFEYSFGDGRFGTVGSKQSPVACGNKSVIVDGEIWSSFEVRQTDTRFQSDDITLAGRLIEPMDANDETPLLIYAHGSERTSWIDHFRDPFHMVARGISVFVYDKRGTGLSEGTYTQNFPKLADDLVLASREAKRLAKGRFGSFGLGGLSQGGWIAPLAAPRAEAEFVAIGYGLVVDIREEDASQVQKQLREKGFSDDILAKASEITEVTARIATSEYIDGIDELAEIQRLYASEEWFRAITTGYTGVFLKIPAEDLRLNGVPEFNGLDIDWSLSPVDVLREIDVPQLWILAGEDREAPIEKTVERLQMLRAEGSEIDIFVFPDTDHTMREFIQAPDGTRDRGKVTVGYYDLFADWVKGNVDGEYGTSFAIDNE